MRSLDSWLELALAKPQSKQHTTTWFSCCRMTVTLLICCARSRDFYPITMLYCKNFRPLNNCSSTPRKEMLSMFQWRRSVASWLTQWTHAEIAPWSWQSWWSTYSLIKLKTKWHSTGLTTWLSSCSAIRYKWKKIKTCRTIWMMCCTRRRSLGKTYLKFKQSPMTSRKLRN